MKVRGAGVSEPALEEGPKVPGGHADGPSPASGRHLLAGASLIDMERGKKCL